MFIISNPDLVIAQCKAGVVGSFPALNARPAEELDRWLDKITSELADYDAKHPDRPSAPFAVNQIVHGSNDRLQHDMDMCVKYKVPIVITSLGAKEFVNEAVHSYGGLVFHDIINNRFAKKAIDKGADGLIAVAAGAGGHAGTISPFALVQEIREWFDGPLLLSGAISSGQAVLGAQAMGADLGYIGSAFIATEEANAEQAYKQAIVDNAAADIVYSNLMLPPISSTVTSSPAFTVTTCAHPSRPPGWTRTTCPRATPRRWTLVQAVAPTPKPGRTSGAAARVSVPLKTSCPPRNWSND
jgi:nitronate monooxygenase